MNNPYLLDKPYQDGQETTTGLAVVMDAYNRLPQYKEEEAERIISLTHPYKSVKDVLDALDKTPHQVDQVLSKMNPQLRKDKDAMLQLIGKTTKAYLYAHQSILNPEFKQQALKQNPRIYSYLTIEDKKKIEISNAYLDGMNKTTQPTKIHPVISSMQYRHQFDPTTNFEQVFSPENYEREYVKMLADGVYKQPGYTLTTSWTYIATAEAMASNRGELAHMLDQYAAIQHNALTNHFKANPSIAHCDRSLPSAQSHLLDAIEAKCPEVSLEIKREQQLYWESRRQEIDGICERAINGAELQANDMRVFQEAMKHIQLREEQKQRMEMTLKREQESIAYLKNDHIEELYAKEIDGSAQTVTGAVSRLETVGNVGTHAQNYERLAYAQDWEQKYHDVVETGSVKQTTLQKEFQEDKELEMDQRMNHRTVIKESHEAQDKRDAEIEKAEIQSTNGTEEEVQHIHPSWAMAPEEEEEEKHYAWNETPPDVERHPVYNPKG